MLDGCENCLMTKRLIEFAALMVGKTLKATIDIAIGPTDLYVYQSRTIRNDQDS